MNITRENIDDLNAILTIKVEKPDYEEKVETVLKDYRKKANIKGFRPGMVPIGLVKKMYGKAVRVDEINKVVSESIQKYLSDEKIEILGDPLPRSEDFENMDFETQEEYSFSFELGLTPALDIDLSKKDVVSKYIISIDDKMRNDYIENYTRRFGELRQVDSIEDKDVVKGSVAAIDEAGNVKPEGPAADETSIGIDVIKEESIKTLFIGKKPGETVDFDLRTAYPNDYEIAGILKMKSEEVKDINGSFRFTVNEISRFFPSEINKELFDKIYGEDVVKTEEEFKNKVEEEIASNLLRETEYKLMLDLKQLAISRNDVKFPEEFLKKWLLKVNEKVTAEQIEQEFDSFKKDLRWQLFKNKVARENEVKITEEELVAEASKITRYQFQQYGLYYATDEQIEKYAKETLKREEDAKRIADKIVEDKVIAILREKVTLEDKSISSEDFNKLFEQEKA
ncbi:MAG TPA: trigger factor [Bacteroidales bacterium]|nr:trigger factor [Bacteroidales bacterium]